MKVIRYWRLVLLLIWIPLFCGGCSTEDDVVEIFTGKTWKLARLTDEGSGAQFYQSIWQDNESREKSIDRLRKQAASYTIIFEGSSINGEIMGASLKGQGIGASFSGTWIVDGEAHTLRITDLKVTGTESDPLAKVFIAALRNVYKYQGDNNSLTLYYKDGNNERIIGLVPLR